MRWICGWAAVLLLVAACGGGGGGGAADAGRGDAFVIGDQQAPKDAPGEAAGEAGKDPATETPADPGGDPAPDPVGPEAGPDPSPPDEGPDHAQADEATAPEPAPEPGPEPVPEPTPEPAPEPVPEPVKDAFEAETVGPKTGTCASYYDCLGQCPEPVTVSCASACYNALSQDGKDQQTALESCLSTHECFGLSDEQFASCLETNCLDPYFRCFAGEKYFTCVELDACLRACPDGDSTCVAGCFEGAGYLANWDWEKRIRCLRSECPACAVASPTADDEAQCNACAEVAIFGACGEEYQRCWPAGNAKCGELWSCTQSCTDGDQACVNACWDNATFAAQGKMQAIFTCIDQQCPGLEGQAWLDCANPALNGACAPAYDACQTDQAGCETHCQAGGCGADGCGGLCGMCQAGTDCDGLSATCVAIGQEYPLLCAGTSAPSASSCPAWASYEGCCDDQGRVVFCDADGKLYCLPCKDNSEPAQQTCGWRAVDDAGDPANYYDCGGSGADPSGSNPLACP